MISAFLRPFGELLMAARNARGLSQAAVADELAGGGDSPTQPTVCKWEKGDGRPPDAAQYAKIVELLKVPEGGLLVPWALAHLRQADPEAARTVWEALAVLQIDAKNANAEAARIRRADEEARRVCGDDYLHRVGALRLGGTVRAASTFNVTRGSRPPENRPPDELADVPEEQLAERYRSLPAATAVHVLDTLNRLPVRTAAALLESFAAMAEEAERAARAAERTAMQAAAEYAQASVELTAWFAGIASALEAPAADETASESVPTGGDVCEGTPYVPEVEWESKRTP